MNDTIAKMFAAQEQAFEERFGRKMGLTDLFFPDPFADGQGMASQATQEQTRRMIMLMLRAFGENEASQYAYHKVGNPILVRTAPYSAKERKMLEEMGVGTEPNIDRERPEERVEWEVAYQEGLAIAEGFREPTNEWLAYQKFYSTLVEDIKKFNAMNSDSHESL